MAPSYLPGSPTPNPTLAPTASPTETMVTCTQNGGSGCCNLCENSPCTMMFSDDVTFIGNILILFLIIISNHICIIQDGMHLRIVHQLYQ